MATTPSANPLRLQVADRIVAVLSAITAGANYWFTPGMVAKRFMALSEMRDFPCYMVSTGTGGNLDLSGSPDEYDETFYLIVRGVVKASDDAVTPLEQALRDVRKAINDDSTDRATTGALGNIDGVDEVRIDSVETDDGYLASAGFGFFELRIRVVITGAEGEL